jgi:hypothetical protein
MKRLLPLLCLLIYLALSVVTNPIAADEPSVSPASLLYRREYIPVDLLEREAKGFVPVPREEFAKLLAGVEQNQSTQKPTVWLAHSSAVFEKQGDTLHGTIRLHIEQINTAAPVLFSLGEFPGTLSQPRWIDHATERVVWGRDTKGELWVQVEHSGILEFTCAVQGQPDPWGTVLFEMTPPNASRHDWKIALPERGQVSASRGLMEPPASGMEPATWQWLGSGGDKVRFRVPASNAADQTSKVLVHVTTFCTAQESALDIAVNLQLDVYHEPLRELELNVVGDWLPLVVRNGNQTIPFRLEGKAGQERLLLQFDPPLIGASRRLTVEGRAAWQDKTSRVAPRLFVKQGDWMEGYFHLHVPAELEAYDWKAKQARWIPDAITAAKSGADHSWQWLGIESELSFSLKQRALQTKVLQGTTVTMNSDRVIAKVIADLHADRPGAFVWEGAVAEGWLVENVSTTPSNILENWELVPKGKAFALRCTCRQSPSGELPTRLVIQAYREPIGTRGLPGKVFPLIHWQSQVLEGVTAIHAESASAYQLENEYLTRPLKWSELSSADHSRLALTSDDVAWLLRDGTFAPIAWQPATEAAKLRAELTTELNWEPNDVKTTLRATIIPEHGSVERVRLLIRPAMNQPLDWQLADRKSPFVARKIASSETSQQEEWELEFSRPLREPVTCVATVAAQSTATPLVVPLLACSMAESQRGFITVLCHAGAHPQVLQNSGVAPVYVSSTGQTQYHWQYDPVAKVHLELRSADETELATLQQVTTCRLSSRLCHDHVLHEFRVQVAAPPESEFALSLPAGCRWRSLEVNGVPVTSAANATGASRRFKLAPQTWTHELRGVVEQSLESSAPWQKIEPAWPQFAAHVLERQWEIVVPERFFLLKPTDAYSWSEHWQSMFFQPLWPHAEVSPFHDAKTWPGCRVLTFSQEQSIPNHVWCCSSLWLTAWGGLAMLVFSLLTPHFKQRGIFSLVMWIGVCVLLGSMIPTYAVALRTACFAGVCIGLVLPPVRWNFPRFSTLISQRRVAGVVTSWFLVVAGVAGLIAQEKPIEKIHRVLFPVDDKREPSGDYVYMSETLFTQLHALQKTSDAGPSVLFGNLDLQWLEGEETAFPVAQSAVQLEIEVLRSEKRIFIPWNPTGLHVPTDSVQLNNRAVAWTWNEEAHGMWLESPNVGRHTLTFRAQPKERGGEQQQPWKLQLPQHTAAKLAWKQPLSPRIETIPLDLPHITHADREWEARNISGLSELTVNAVRVDMPSKPTQVRELLWARVWPGGSVVEGRWKFTKSPALPKTLEIACPRSWQLLSAAANVPAKVLWQRTTEESNVQWRLETSPAEVEVIALFHLPRSHTTQWSFPRFQPQQVEVTQSWGGINLANSTQLVISPEKPFSGLAVQPFVDVWNAPEKPAFVVDLQQEQPEWIFPKEQPMAFDASPEVIWEVHPEHVAWEFTTQLHLPKETPATLILQLPIGSKLTDVVGHGMKSSALPWLTLSGGRILIGGLSHETTDRLQVTGTLAMGTGEKRTASVPRLENVIAPPMNVLLRHSPWLDVKFQPSPLWLPAPQSATNVGELTHIATWQAAEGAPVANTTLEWASSLHAPRWKSQWTTSLERHGTAWKCRFEGEIAVAQGSLSQLTFAWPVGWKPPQRVAGDVELSFLKADTESNPTDSKGATSTIPQLVVSFPVAAATHHTFTLETELLEPEAWDRRVPLIQCQQRLEEIAYIRVPADASTHWETQGVREIMSLEEPAVQVGEQKFQVVSPTPVVRLQRLPSQQALPRVALLESEISTTNGESNLGRSVWWIDPAGATACPCELSVGTKLVRVTIDGRETLLSHNGAIPLRSSHLPQAIRLEYQLGNAADKPPRPGDWPIEHELAEFIGDGNLPQERLNTLLRLIESGLNQPADIDEPTAAWCSWWYAELAHTISVLPTDFPQQQPEDWERATMLLKRLSPLLETPHTALPDPLEPLDVPLVSAHGAENAAPSAVPRRSILFTLMIGIVWLGIVTGVAYLSEQVPIQEWLRRNQLYVRTMFGVLLMLLFVPFWIGAYFAVTAALSVFAWPWQPARVR